MLIDRGVLRRPGPRGGSSRSRSKSRSRGRSTSSSPPRLDTLPADEKALVQDAAVTGRSSGQVRSPALSDRPLPDVRGVLRRLRVTRHHAERAPGLRRRGHSRSNTSSSATSRTSAAEAAAREKHVDGARWAEERTGDRERRSAELLGAHYLQAIGSGTTSASPRTGSSTRRRTAGRGRPALGPGSCGSRRRRSGGSSEALRLGERSGADTERLAEIAEAAAVAADGLMPIDAVVDGFRAAIDRFEALGRDGDVGRMQVAIGYTLVRAAKLEEAQRWVERGIAALERHGESADLARALEILGNLPAPDGIVDRRRGAVTTKRGDGVARRRAGCPGPRGDLAGDRPAARGPGRRGAGTARGGLRGGQPYSTARAPTEGVQRPPVDLHGLRAGLRAGAADPHGGHRALPGGPGGATRRCGCGRTSATTPSTKDGSTTSSSPARRAWRSVGRMDTPTGSGPAACCSARPRSSAATSPRPSASSATPLGRWMRARRCKPPPTSTSCSDGSLELAATTTRSSGAIWQHSRSSARS